MLPRQRRAIVPVQRVANLVIGDCHTVKCGQAICSYRVGVRVGYRIDGFAVQRIHLRKEVAAGVVGIGDGVVRDGRPVPYGRGIVLRCKLIQRIIGVGDVANVGGLDTRNIARVIIAVADGGAVVDIVFDAGSTSPEGSSPDKVFFR